MKIFVFSILFLTLSISAIGQTAPDPNSLGIYFDEGAIENVQYATAPTTVHAYLIATRISSTYGIEAWDCIYKFRRTCNERREELGRN